MAYDSNTQIISAPVSVYDVQRALGNGSTDVGTLCKASTVNKWAKYKPVGKNKIDTTDELNNPLTNKTWKSTSSWWRGSNNKCGINYVTFANVAAVKSSIDNHTVVWSRIAPIGGSSEPFRLIDFNQYNHMALAPTFDIGTTNAVMTPGAEFHVMASRSPAAGDNITLADIGDFSSYYFTAAIYTTGGSLALIHSADDNLGTLGESGNFDITFKYSSDVGGYSGALQQNQDYKVYCFLSSYKYVYQDRDVEASRTLIPLPNGTNDYGIAPADLHCQAYSQWMNCDAYIETAGGTLVKWTAYMFGARTTAEIRLVDLQGNIVLNPSTGTQQKYTIDFNNGTATQPPMAAGWILEAGVHTSFTIPTNNPELYRVQLVSTGFPTCTAVIGYILTPIE